MRRSVYILAGFSGLIIGALLLAWQILGSSAGLGAQGLGAAGSPISRSILITSCAVCAASAWFLRKVMGPPK